VFCIEIMVVAEDGPVAGKRSSGYVRNGTPNFQLLGAWQVGRRRALNLNQLVSLNNYNAK
jgi:hypothetical protein